MTLEKAFFILRHGSAEGEHKYFEAISVIENEYNRQKAEIERLTADNEYLQDKVFKVAHEVKAEAIKEFAERLKNASGSAVAVQDGRELYETKSYTINAMKLDNLVEEMAGES